MRQTMQDLWAQVLLAESGIGEGEPGALEHFIQAAGTMIENFQLAKILYSKNRVGRRMGQWCFVVWMWLTTGCHSRS